MSRSVQKGFSRFERNGIILLCALIILSIVAKKYVVQHFRKDTPLTANDKLRIAHLQQQINDAKTTYSNSNSYYEKKDDQVIASNHPEYKKKDYSDFKIEVNSATAEEYEKLYGIGKVFSQRIVTFRDKLGGFYSINQVKDVYGIEDSTFQKFKKNLTIKPAKIRKVNINSATYEELTANPYLFSTLAKQIVGYRTKVKPFAEMDDVKNLYYIRDHPETFDKIAPYISLN
ncbi:MAG: helix-hairpin-helix protein [Bacteroidota bacterium]|nr:helix-hairpin-helix protein [Bacteroidota bacterium]